MMGDDIVKLIKAYKSKKSRFVLTFCLQMVVENDSPQWLKVLRAVMSREELARAHTLIPSANFLMNYYSWPDALNRLAIGFDLPVLGRLAEILNRQDFRSEYMKYSYDQRAKMTRIITDNHQLEYWMDLIPDRKETYLVLAKMIFYEPVSEDRAKYIISHIPRIWYWLGLELRTLPNWPPPLVHFYTWNLDTVVNTWKLIGESDLVLFRLFKNRSIEIRYELAEKLN